MKIFQKYALEINNPDKYADSRIVFANFDNTLIKDEVTILVWFKPKYIHYGENQYLVSLVNRFAIGYIAGDGRKIFRFIWAPRTDDPDYYEGGGDYVYDWQENIWQHWAATLRGGRYKGFVNGTKMFDRMDDPITFKSYHDRLVIGGLSSYGCINGTIGEVRIYDRALSDAEIQYLYNGGHIEDGLVFWLYPDEESVTLDSDGETVLSITEKVNGYIGTAYNGVKLVNGKDVDSSSGKRVLLVKKV